MTNVDPHSRRAEHRNAPARPRVASSPKVATTAVAAAPAAIVLLCCALPLGWLVWQIVSNPVALGGVQMDGFRWALLARTLGYNAAAGVLAALLALPAAAVLGRGRGRVVPVLAFLLPLTLLLPSLTYAYGWAQLVRLLSEPLGRALAAWPGAASPALEWLGVTVDVGDGPGGAGGARAFLVPAGRADVARCVFSLAAWLWPVPAGLVGLALRRLDASLQQQALLDGAPWRITARQLAGPLAAGVACVTVLAAQEFAVYEPTGISVVATEVRQVFQTGAFSSPTNPITAPMAGMFGAADTVPSDASGPTAPPPSGDDLQRFAAAAAVATALPLTAIVAVLGVAAAWGVRRVSAAEDLDADGGWPAALDAGLLSKALALLVVAVTLGVPVAAMLLRHRIAAHLNPAFVWAEAGDKVLGSLLLATLAGAVALVVAAGGSLRARPWLLPVALAAFLVGGQLLAIALLRLYNRPGLGWISNAPPITVMAYVARFGWLVLLAAGATWSPPWRRLRDLAAVDGAGPARVAWHVVAPLAWPLLSASALLVGILSLSEVPATVLISPVRPQPLVPMLMTWVHLLESDPMIEASLLLMAVVAALSLVAAGLAWAGVRLSRHGLAATGGRATRTLIAAGLVALPLLSLAGCGDPTLPEAVWCETGTAPGQVVYPRALAYAPADDTFWVIDRVARVQHLDRTGRFLNGWQMPDSRNGKPVGCSVGPYGNLYVPDTHYHRVMVYSPAGALLRQWGSDGRGDGQFIFPTDVAFDDKGRVFVSEYGGNDRVQVFDLASGRKLFQFGKFGDGDGEFSRPQSLVIDAGFVYITDACNHRLVVFTTDGQFVRNMGGVGSALGQFRFPYGLAEDGHGRLVVCEFGNNRVQLVDKATGQGLKTWGAAGREPGQLAYPWGVAVDKHDRVVAVDAGNNRLQVFEF